MLFRKPQDQAGTFLPDEWREEVQGTLFNLYQNHCQREKKTFEVYGLSYPDEIFLTASYLDFHDLNKIPVTYTASADLSGEKKNIKKILDTLVDSIGIFFDSFFHQKDWNDYISVWTKARFKNQVFYYQVTRERIGLTLQADEILK